MSPSVEAAPPVRIERIIHAEPARVFRAWTDPVWVCRWMNPGKIVADRASVELRVGGRFRLWQSLNGQDIGGAEGEFVEIVPDRKLVYRWAFVGPDRGKDEFYDTLVTVNFTPETGGRTRVVILHEQLESLLRGAPEVAEQVHPAWNSCLDQLDRALSDPAH